MRSPLSAEPRRTGILEEKKEVKSRVNLYFQFPEPSPEDPLWETESCGLAQQMEM